MLLGSHSVPKNACALRQRNVIGVLGVSGSKDPGRSSVAAAIMRRRELVESDYSQPLAREFQAGERPHGSQADHGGIKDQSNFLIGAPLLADTFIVGGGDPVA